MEDKKLEELLYQIGEKTPECNLNPTKIYANKQEKTKKPFYKRGWFISLSSVCSVFVVALIIGTISLYNLYLDDTSNNSSSLYLYDIPDKEMARSESFLEYYIENSSIAVKESGIDKDKIGEIDKIIIKPYILKVTGNVVSICFGSNNKGYYIISLNDHIIDVKQSGAHFENYSIIGKVTLDKEEGYFVIAKSSPTIIDIAFDEEFTNKYLNSTKGNIDLKISFSANNNIIKLTDKLDY